MDKPSESQSYFGRPLASSDAPSGNASSKPAATGEKQPLQTLQQNNQNEFVPNLFDFITLARRQEASANVAKQLQNIPPLYQQSEAVDTSIEIGSGATFVAYYRPLPKHVPKERIVDMGGWTTSTKEQKQDRPEVIVYKTARVAFDKYGEALPDYRRAAQSALMEMYALGHGPLVEHPNIIKLLGLAWGSNPTDPNTRLPAIITEFAQYGSFANLLAHRKLEPEVSMELCAGVAEGLHALHQCGIIHGDVKAENVLICVDANKKMTAKLGDFGFSIIGQAGQDLVRIGGTRPWRAPEADQPITRDMLAKTDLYSYGLLLWRVMSQTANPFVAFLETKNAQDDQDSSRNAIETLKAQESFHKQIHVEVWYPKLHMKPLIDMFFAQDQSVVKQQLKSMLSAGSISQPAMSEQIMETFLSQSSMFWTAVEKVAASYPWTAKFNLIVDHCLKLNPKERDFNPVLEALRSQNHEPSNASRFPQQRMILMQDYKHHSISWETLNHIDPSLQTAMTECLRELYESKIPSQTQEPYKYFIYAAMCISGIGTTRNYEVAKQAVLAAANGGSMVAQAYGWRIFRGMAAEETPNFNFVMARNASLGCRLALEDLAELEPETAKTFRKKNQELKAGIGGEFFSSKNMLNGSEITSWIHFFDNAIDELLTKARAVKVIANAKLNRRGDGIIHVAAACGKVKALEALLDEFPEGLPVDILNQQGETPLLCACRSGHFEAAWFLLSRGADASIKTPFGEAPLHWLVSFTPDEVQDIGDLLFASGANAEVVTTVQIGYSSFPTGLDVDHKPPSSPLFWAVHENRPDVVDYLMSREGSDKLPYQKAATYHSPMEQAVYFHHAECLKVMARALGLAKFTSRTELMTKCILGANRFSMMIRHGGRWKQSFTDTMEFMVDAMKNIASFGVDGRGMTHLHYAISSQKPDAVEFLLDRGLAINADYEKGRLKEDGAHDYTTNKSMAGRPGAIRPEHISAPHSLQEMTPLLEAVNTNQMEILELLIQRGANPQETAINPFTSDQRSWTALHVLAQARHQRYLDLAHSLLKHKVPIDGLRDSGDHPLCETPLMIACVNDAFTLATLFLENGADVNAKSLGCSFFSVPRPMSLLGHIAASAARHSTARIKYLLYDCPQREKVEFLVDTQVQLTALHRAAAGCGDLYQRGPEVPEKSLVTWAGYDWPANREIMYELLQKWHEPEHLDAVEIEDGETALHYAVTAWNVGCVDLLLNKGARFDIKCKKGKTAWDLAQAKKEEASKPGTVPEVVRCSNKIVQLLEAKRMAMGVSQVVTELQDLELD